MFGGWRTAFTIGYGLPLQDFLFASEGKRYLNFVFGSPMIDLVIENLIVKVGYLINLQIFVHARDCYCYCRNSTFHVHHQDTLHCVIVFANLT